MEKFARILFFASLSAVALGAAFMYGVLAHRNDLPPMPTIRAVSDVLRNGVHLRSAANEHLQPARGQGDGVVRDATQDDHLVLMVGFFEGENQARLVERDGTVQHRWSLDYLQHFPDESRRVCDYVRNPLEVDMHGALVTEAGELVFNYEYCGTVKLDQCGAVQWTIADGTHHSMSRAEAGGYWLLGRDAWSTREQPGRFPPFSAASSPGFVQEDTVMRVSEAGEVLEEFSIPQAMRASGLLPLLTATGHNYTRVDGGRYELVHANKVTELTTDLADAFPLFEAGDLAISMRELNLVLVLDGETREVKWHQTGPWLRQHDPEFRPDGRISIFNNNVFRNAYFTGEKTDLSGPFATNIMVIDPVTRQTEVVFGERPGEEMLSVIRGQHELLPGGGMIITEFDAGRVIEVDARGRIVWDYVNRHDADSVGEISDARVYPRSHFEAGIPGETPCP